MIGELDAIDSMDHDAQTPTFRFLLLVQTIGELQNGVLAEVLLHHDYRLIARFTTERVE